jgi:hypothetical protein
MYKPISASKVGKTHAPAYHGFLSENSEIGAVSACGIRDKNEAAYVILSDLLHTNHLEVAFIHPSSHLQQLTFLYLVSGTTKVLISSLLVYCLY